MNQAPKKRRTSIWLVIGIFLVGGGVAAGVMRERWLPTARNWIGAGKAKDPKTDSHAHGPGAGHSHGADDGHAHSAAGGHDHGADDGHGHSAGDDHSHGANDGHSAGGNGDVANHSHAAHDSEQEANSIELSALAWKNIGLKTSVIQPQSYVKTVSAPAMVTERPGRSQVNVAAQLTGIVTRIYCIEGEAIQPGQALFELRLTHEDLVTAQRDFLRSAQELDVVKREIARLKTVGDGVVAGRRVVEQQYEQQKIEAAILAQRQGLLLHGMTDAHIDSILQDRRLLAVLTVSAPEFEDDADDHELHHIYHVQSIPVKRGQSVAAGESLAVLADHCVLYVEGQAFETDAAHLLKAAKSKQLVRVSSITPGASSNAPPIEMPILYLADHFEEDSRAQTFYLRLPNTLIRDEQTADHRFITWKFRPGQRMSVEIPIGKEWENQIVLPPEAVVNEGAESYVFQEAKDHFDRVPVHVLFRDRNAIVVENDGKLIGKKLAMSGAYQMHLAIKNRAGGGASAHGHSH